MKTLKLFKKIIKTKTRRGLVGLARYSALINYLNRN